MELGLTNYGKEGFKGVTETWNIVQHEVILILHSVGLKSKKSAI